MAVQISSPDRARPPARGGQDGELATVIPLDPSRAEEGFFDEELLYQNLLARDPLSVIGGVWRGVNQVRQRLQGDTPPHSNPIPKRLMLPREGHNHLLLVTEPDPELGVDPDTADNIWIKPGLGELGDIGSGLRLHIVAANQHPEHRIITETTEGVNHTGKVVSQASLAGRNPETMAAESLYLMRRLTRDGDTEMIGTSLGSVLEWAIAEMNLGANPHEQLPIRRLKLVASAVIADMIEGAENFRDPDIDEDEYRQNLSDEFQLHTAVDFGRMAISNPGDILACWPMLGAYAIAHPAKTRDRIRTMMTDYANVKKGVPWDSLKYVVAGVPVDVLGGERDPLTREQVPQWEALDNRYPGQVQMRVVQGMGHLMSADARGTIAHLADMDGERESLVAAA